MLIQIISNGGKSFDSLLVHIKLMLFHPVGVSSVIGFTVYILYIYIGIER